MRIGPLDDQLQEVAALISNNLHNFDCAGLSFIIGSSPSAGARSPRLWNAAYEKLGIDARMQPLDTAQEQVASLIGLLGRIERVQAILIAAPYKQLVASELQGCMSSIASRSGSVNLLTRDKEGRFFGHNTDGAGAVIALQNRGVSLSNNKFVILGCGGTGRALAAALLENGVERSSIQFIVRRLSNPNWMISNSFGFSYFDQISETIPKAKVLINCTTVGWGDQSDKSPLTEIQLAQLPQDALIFDVVYQSGPTKLIQICCSLGLRVLEGGELNLLQAVKGFQLTYPSASDKEIEQAMQRAIQQQRSQ